MRCQNQTKDELKSLKGQEKEPAIGRNHHDALARPEQKDDTILVESKSETNSQIVKNSTAKATLEKLKTTTPELTCLPPPEVSCSLHLIVKLAESVPDQSSY